MSKLMIREPDKVSGPCEYYTDFGHNNHLSEQLDYMWLLDDGHIITEKRGYGQTHSDLFVPSDRHYSDLFHGSYDVVRKIITSVPPDHPKWDTMIIPSGIVQLLAAVFPEAEELIYF
jgi:hypothetical protein